MKDNPDRKLVSERNKLLRTIIRITEIPMIVLGFIWLGLLILELLNKSTPLLERAGIIIWIIFIADFLLKFTISSSKKSFLKKNVITVISLIVPAFRLFRIVRIIRMIRLSRGLRLVKLIGSFNRGMRSLALTMKKRALGYVILLSAIVVFIGAAGLFAFEREVNPGFKTYPGALWWTAMMVMSVGTENWPVTPEGRILVILIALYGLAVFGYVTASIATFFIDRDAEKRPSDPVTFRQLEELKKELAMLQSELLKLNRQNNSS